MNDVNVFTPGEDVKPMADQVAMRVEKGGASVLGKGYKTWTGLDACKGCPLFNLNPVE